MKGSKKSGLFLLVLLAISLLAPAIPQVQADPDIFTVSQGSDDCTLKRTLEWFTLTYAQIMFGDADASNYDYESGMRWEVDIEQGAIIDSAYLKIVSAQTKVSIPTLIIWGEDADDPLIFSTAINYKNRVRTSASVEWTPAVWSLGVEYTSPDISSIIQEIVDREGFGTHIVLFMVHEIGWGGVSNMMRGASYEHPTYDPPKLEITVTPPIYPPSDPDLLFGAGFNASSPYVELHWNHSLVDVQFFEVQNSSDGESWTYLGQSTTANYTDTQVVNGTERYYKVRACNQTEGSWYNSSWADVNFETVYFLLGVGDGVQEEDYSIIFLAIGLILMLSIAFLYVKTR